MTAPSMITPEYLDRLTRLCEAATKFPWSVMWSSSPGFVALANMEKACVGTLEEALANASFIAAAREAVPALIAALQAERARSAARLEALEQANKLMNHMGDILNCHDMVTDEDEEMSTPIFELVARALAAAEGGGDADQR